MAINIFILVSIYGGLEDKGGFFQLLSDFVNFKTPYWNIFWFWFPLVIWGIVVLIQGVYVFGYGSSWEERKIREIMEKEDRSQY